MSQSIVVLGTGGHGWMSLRSYIESSSSNIQGFCVPADWGGSTGLWGRLLEYNAHHLNKKLHSDPLPVLPWGDLNKIFIYFLDKKFGDKFGEKVLNLRSDSIRDHQEVFSELTRKLATSSQLTSRAWDYFQLSFEYYLQVKQELHFPSKPFCFSYPWHQFLYYTFGSIEAISRFYQDREILPANFQLDFTHHSRQILIGQSSGEPLEGEEIIDDFRKPIDPYSLKLIEIDRTSARVNNLCISSLQHADWIMFPNGSIANWLGLLKNNDLLQTIQQKSLESRIIWLLNPIYTPNEYPISDYIDYLETLSIFPILLGPKSPPVGAGDFTLNFSSESDKNKLSKFPIRYELEITDDWKYDPTSVYQVLSNILN